MRIAMKTGEGQHHRHLRNGTETDQGKHRIGGHTPACRLPQQPDENGGNQDGEQRHEDRHGVLREFALGSSEKNHAGGMVAPGKGLFDVRRGAGHNVPRSPN
jgi:hypothetical protein